jgi:hypothetical protein
MPIRRSLCQDDQRKREWRTAGMLRSWMRHHGLQYLQTSPPIPRLCKFIKLWENDRRATAPFNFTVTEELSDPALNCPEKRNWPEIWVCHSHAHTCSLDNLTRNTSKRPYYSLLPLSMSDGASSRLIEFQKSFNCSLARYSYCGSNSTTLVSPNFGLPFNLDK